MRFVSGDDGREHIIILRDTRREKRASIRDGFSFFYERPVPPASGPFPNRQSVVCCVLRDMHVSCNELRPPAFATALLPH